MSDSRVTTVLILAEPATGRKWEEMLRGPETRIWLGRSAIPAGEHPEIILTNSHALPVAPRDEVGVIQVDSDGPADVRLSADCTAEELQRICRLLAEVVRLRRLERQARETNRELAQAASTDSLTGLANRRAWDQELAQRLAHAAGGRQLCLAVLDLDQFKELNDAQGHAAGDRVLQAVGRWLQKNVRQGDFVARIGGDEFALLLWAPGAAEAAAIVQRLRSGIAEAVCAEIRVKITASAGFALSGGGPGTDIAESLFLAADAALLAAKRRGRDTLRPHPPPAMK